MSGSDADLTVVRGVPAPPGRVMTWQDLLSLVRRFQWHRLLFRHRRAQLLVPRWNTLSKPFLTAVLVRLLARKEAVLLERGPASRPIDLTLIVCLGAAFLRDCLGIPALLNQTRRLLRQLKCPPLARPKLDPTGRPLYLKSDLVFGLKAGGSIAHTAGVLNVLDRVAAPPIAFLVEPMPTLRADLDIRYLSPPERFWDFSELPSLAFNQTAFEQVCQEWGTGAPAFVYQRYGLNSLTGLQMARHHNVPFVLEYNGSEIWVARNWGAPLRHEGLSQQIEDANLTGATLIVVVSQALRDELAARGIPHHHILVNPNGVDPERFSPHQDGTAIRQRWDLQNHTVIGFLGSFGPWHGAPVLVEAFARRLAHHSNARLLLVGDGVDMPLVQAAIDRHHLHRQVILTGTIPQDDAPRHLAACDILAAPHVPNPDGSPFFGSPTKLFEYMAMGKPIVASRLGQIADVLQHGQTGWLVEPGDANALADGLLELIQAPALAQKLGHAAREQALTHHTWEQHTKRIVDKLQELCG